MIGDKLAFIPNTIGRYEIKSELGRGVAGRHHTPNDEKGWISATVLMTTVDIEKLPVFESP